MCVEQDSGFVFSPEMLHPDEGPTEFCEHFLSIVETTGLLPAEIWIKREELMDAMESAASQLKISLNRVDQLPMLEEATSGLLDYLDR